MRTAFVIVALLAGTAAADDRKEMGKWDCSGSKPVEKTFQPGTQTLVWRGECNGAEGYNVVIEPKPSSALLRKEKHDMKAKEIVLEVTNPTKAPITVKLHVFVGFA